MICEHKQETSTLLELHHEDYSMYVTAPTQQGMLQKAMELIGEEALATEFRWSPDARLFVKDIYEDKEIVAEKELDADKLQHGIATYALFFENTEYQVEIEFQNSVLDAELEYPRYYNEKSEIQKRDSFMARRRMLSFTHNFGNQIGKSHIKVNYRTADNEWKHLVLKFDVLSTKLDYHQDLKVILEDIEREYTMLSISFLRQTYHTFNTDINSNETPDLIWWNIFKGIQEEFCRAVAMVIDRPHNRLKRYLEPLRADQLKRVTPTLENELAEHKSEERYLYLAEQWQLNDDTVENRFMKFALHQIAEKFMRLNKHIHEKNRDSLPKGYAKELDATEETLRRLEASPFLRRIGRFTGLRGENLTLKQATGYSTIYRDWLLLQSTYDLHDGVSKMELKDISELYEIWCFIKVKNLVRELMARNKDLETEEIDQSLPKASVGFGGLPPGMILKLNRGQQSKVVLHQGDITLAEIIYNAQLTANTYENEQSGMGGGVGSLTVPQRPDIVLRLTKDDIEKGIEMTYLFDAKYRLEVNNGHQVPPDDAINQMHRYRDAIYYSDIAYRDKSATENLALKREVLGGYILFPGKEPETWDSENYLLSIPKVNIGAFPLRPSKDGTKDRFLRQFLAEIIEKPRIETLLETIPQRGLEYQSENEYDVVLVNYADKDHWKLHLDKKLCYLRTGDAGGSIKLPAFGKEPKYLLLHNGSQHELFRLSQEGGKIYSKEELKNMGFSPSQDGFYLCYSISSTKPVIIEGLDFDSLTKRGKGTNVPHIEKVKI